MAKKIGEDFAREWFRRGLAELREIGYFSGSNVAQPNYLTPTGRTDEPPRPEPDREHPPTVERER